MYRYTGAVDWCVLMSLDRQSASEHFDSSELRLSIDLSRKSMYAAVSACFAYSSISVFSSEDPSNRPDSSAGPGLSSEFGSSKSSGTGGAEFLFGEDTWMAGIGGFQFENGALLR